MVIAFARSDSRSTGRQGTPSAADDLYYNVLSLDINSSSDAVDWDGWRRLEMPNEVRPAGMQLINVPSQYGAHDRLAKAADASVPFRVVSSQEYVYLLRQTVGGTLLVNRFRLVRQASPDNPQEAAYVLSPAWEVRFQRSGKPDIPYDDTDVQSFLDPEREPFVEPAYEVPVPGITDGRFDAALLPHGDGASLTCTIMVARETDRVDVYELPLDAAGHFVLDPKALVDGRLAADFSFTLQTPDHEPLRLSGRPALAYYLKQERVRSGDSDSFLIKRAGRLMLALRAQPPNAKATLATVDFGAAADGTIARPAEALATEPVGVAPYTLDFDASAYVALPDVEVTGGFGFELWLYPRSAAERQLVLGNPDDPAAPRLSLVNGTSLEIAFTDSAGHRLTARTGTLAVRREAWSHVRVDFDPHREAGARFVIRVNDNDLPYEESGSTGTTPGGAPITRLSAPKEGFVGALDSVAIYDAAGFHADHLVGVWSLDTVVYADAHETPLDPPLTPNSAHPDDPSTYGKVFGARLVPSTSPDATGNGGALSFDERGLSVVASHFEHLDTFGDLASSPALLAGTDGLLRCYFQGRDDRLSVMQLDVEAARAVFEATWKAAADASRTGPVQFVAAQAGAFMNSAAITIGDPAGGPREAFCDVTLTSPSGRTETWRGVPRSLVPFALALNGEAVRDPSDPRSATGAATYYDASGTRTAAYVPLIDTANAALAGFVTRHVERLPLASVVATSASDDLLDLTFTHMVPRWPGVSLEHVWREVPTHVQEALRVLRGASTTYAYASSTASNVRTYSITAGSGTTGANTVALFTRPTVESVEHIIVRDDINTDLCTVELSLTESGAAHTAIWTRVPRRQDLFAATIEGTNGDYDYAALASGDHRAVGDALIVITNGSPAAVDDITLTSESGRLPPDADLRVHGSLVEAIVTAPVSAADRLSAPGTVEARAFQSAHAILDGEEKPITGGSELLRTHLAALPDQGSVGLVGNTTGFTDGTAVLVRQGINGGWRNRPDQRTLSFNWDGYVSFPTDEASAPNISALTLQGDLSLELWCRPQRSTMDIFRPHQRLLTFARTPTAAEGGDRVRYLAGLRDCPSLRTNSGTTLRKGYTTTRGTFSTWFSPIATDGVVRPGTIGSLSMLGMATPVVSISVDGDQHVRAEFTLDGQAAPMISAQKVTADEWYQVALPWSVEETSSPQAGTHSYVFTAGLYLNGLLVARQKWTCTVRDKLDLVTMVIGAIDPGTRPTLLMRVNEAAFFARPLTKMEIGHYHEQRIPDNAADLMWKWMLLEGKGDSARNSAATGPGFNGAIKPSATWEKYGLYTRPVLGHGNTIAVLAGEPIIHGWSHLAMVRQAGSALALAGADYVECGHDATTDLSDKFSLETWVEPAPSTAPPQPVTILGKGDDYELTTTHEGSPRFAVNVKIGGTARIMEVCGTEQLTAGAAHHLAATYDMVTVTPAASTGSQGPAEPRYEVHLALWVDGELVASNRTTEGTYPQYTDIVERVSSPADLNLGRSSSHGGSRHLTGFLSDTRLWTRVLSATEIADTHTSRHAPSNHDGLVSWWRFNERAGRIAFDVQGNNDARLNRSDLRVGYQPTSVNTFYVNGRAAAPTWADGPASVGGYPAGDQFAFGQMTGEASVGFHGQLDSVRVWDTQLTGEQIADSMNRELAGDESHLVGLWTFDNGSGPVVEDATGRGNTGRLTGTTTPVWSESTAPLGNEADGVMNILGGVPSPSHDTTTETPSVIEYADLQRDAYGTLFSVMKRAYVSVDEGALQLVTGYKVGDLDTVYLGRAQSEPSLIGFIEGGPPIPSENQTMPLWKNGGSDLNGYVGTTSVTFEEADEVSYVYDSTRDTSSTHAFTGKAGAYANGAYNASVGLGAEVESPIFKFEGHIGGQGGFDFVDQDSEGVGRSSGTTVTMPSTLRPGGAWEPGDQPDKWLNPTVGRRFIPANTGMALVKSLTVDVYAAILTTTRSTVNVTTSPNPDIPEDINILTFPIDPAYVKNGTLDGKVGLRNDPAFPHADAGQGSYFKPLEAITLKQRIEREQARLSAYYQQFDVHDYAQRLRGSGDWRDYRAAQRANAAYDWAAHLAKRNLVNTYVWTAAGGSYAEQMSTMNVYTESYGALSSRTGKAGAVFDIEMSFPVWGFYLDFDYLYSWATEVNVVRSKETSAAFSLSATAEPDGFLSAPQIDGDQITFSSQPAEGKVDGYRYLAFYLAPTTDNFDELRDRVIDPAWYRGSRDPAAVALREATAAANGAWRVLYRVTHVSRIPPRFQPVPDQTPVPPIDPPANAEDNALLTALVEQAVGKPDPSPLEIGAGISAVIGTAERPGPLAALLPWWQQFLADAGDYRLPAGTILRAFREDLLRYMIATYAVRAAGLRS
ncbi:LamG-like jellyroll fold domain-containing protein [Streptomyces sp. BRA346]|uniref:LamG-like jellyroll fold domain-containing protein n=1 Tax=Streptomyces sp. BRA346 TaxID=2878199 RepID=UPI004062E059